jgi:hypothetical protein
MAQNMQFHKNSCHGSDAVVCVWMYGPDEVDGLICMYTARNCFDTILFMVGSFIHSFIAPVNNFSSEHFITIILS